MAAFCKRLITSSPCWRTHSLPLGGFTRIPLTAAYRQSAISIAAGRRGITSEARAQSLHDKANVAELSEMDESIEHQKERQKQRPWHRTGVDEAPVRRQRSAGAMTKGEYQRQRLHG